MTLLLSTSSLDIAGLGLVGCACSGCTALCSVVVIMMPSYDVVAVLQHDCVVHVFTEREREFYDLEGFYKAAEQVRSVRSCIVPVANCLLPSGTRPKTITLHCHWHELYRIELVGKSRIPRRKLRLLCLEQIELPFVLEGASISSSPSTLSLEHSGEDSLEQTADSLEDEATWTSTPQL